MSKETIISHFEKSLEWVGGINTNTLISIYNKSDIKRTFKQPNLRMTNVKNVGRESQTFLLHIYNNYDDLRETNYFLQDDPFSHGVTIDQINQNPPAAFTWLGNWNIESGPTGEPHDSNVEVKQIVEDLGLEIKFPVSFVAGGQFVVSKELILKHPRSFYKDALELFDKYDKAPWAFERLWGVIFS